MSDTPSIISDSLLDVGLWIDPVMLARETPFIRHLIMALISDGHRVTVIAPHGLDLSLLPTLGSRLLTYRWSRWERLPLLQRLRLSGTIEELTARPPDLLLLWGSADPLPVNLVQHATGIPLVVWCWDGSELFTPLLQFPNTRHAIVSSQPLLDRVPSNFRIPVTLIHPGVYSEEIVACYDVPGQIPCLVSLDPLSDLKAYQSLVLACRKLADEDLEYMLFLYDQGHQEHPIWKLVEKHQLLDRLSFVPFQQDAEPLLLHGDLYLHVLPTARVQYRTLEAMGRGLAVISAPNPGADYLLDNHTCRIVRDPTPETWHATLRELILDRPRAAALARNAQQHIRAHHDFSTMLTQFTTVCRQAAGTPLKLNAGP